MSIGCIFLIAGLFVVTLLLSVFVSDKGKEPVLGVVAFILSLSVSFAIFMAVLGWNIERHKDANIPSKIITINKSSYIIDDQGYRKTVHLRNSKTGGIINTIIVSNNQELEWFNNGNFLIQELYTKDMLGNDLFLGYRMIEKTKLEK